VNKDELIISADRKSEKKDEGENFRRIERYSGHVSRTMTLPDNADVENIAAASVDGVLKITIPKVCYMCILYVCVFVCVMHVCVYCVYCVYCVLNMYYECNL
jgi:hypothetical protein